MIYMTPYEHKISEREQLEKELLDRQEKADAWQPPPLWSGRMLGPCLEEMKPFKLNPDDVPFIIKLVENPKYNIGLFAGNVSLFNHDCIHMLLGRGLRVKDEAFVIGYTMGSTKKMWRWRKNLYMFCAKYLFPEGYRFGEEERFVFNLGVMAGSKCGVDLSVVNFEDYLKKPLLGIREKFQINQELLADCYKLERTLFPDSVESQRLKNWT